MALQALFFDMGGTIETYSYDPDLCLRATPDLHRLLRRASIDSSTYGWRKPRPAAFHHAASRAGLPTSACALVGDRISRDISGAMWDAFVSSRDVLVRKPPPRIHDAALKQMGLRPHQALFVGQKAAELDGARALGIKAVAFNRDADARGGIQIGQFAQLLELATDQSRVAAGEEA